MASHLIIFVLLYTICFIVDGLSPSMTAQPTQLGQPEYASGVPGVIIDQRPSTSPQPSQTPPQESFVPSITPGPSRNVPPSIEPAKKTRRPAKRQPKKVTPTPSSNPSPLSNPKKIMPVPSPLPNQSAVPPSVQANTRAANPGVIIAAVIIPALVIAGIVCALIWWLRRKRRNAAVYAATPNQRASREEPSEFPFSRDSTDALF